MLKQLFRVFVALLLSCAVLRGESLSSADLPEFYRPMFKNPYEYMFEGAEQKVDNKVTGLRLGKFLGGIKGLLHYFPLIDCFSAKEKIENRDFYDISAVEKFTGIKVFLKEGKEIDEFSYLNPEIVKWGYENLIPDPKESFDGTTFKEIYDSMFQRFFRLMAEAYFFLEEGKAWSLETKSYLETAKTPKFEALDWLESRYSGALSEYAVERNGSYMTPSMAIGFWLRREADGSRSELWTGLQKVLTQYDAVWFNKACRLYLPATPKNTTPEGKKP